jgi:hypothetical protein
MSTKNSKNQKSSPGQQRAKRNAALGTRNLTGHGVQRIGAKDSSGKSASAIKKAEHMVGMGVDKAALSPCVVNYLAAIGDPFTVPTSPPCIPIPPCLPSMKLTTWCKGSFSTSTTTFVGFIFVDPKLGVVRSNAFGYASTGASASSAFSTGAGIDPIYTNSPYDAVDFNSTDDDKAEYRLVASGLRIKYTGTELNRGGTIVGIVHPNRKDILGMTNSGVLSYAGQDPFSNDSSRPWYSLCWSPEDHDDFDYAGEPLTDGNRCMGFMVNAPSATSLLFSYEFFGHYELVGSNIANKTVMAGDPVGGWAAVDYFTRITDGINYVSRNWNKIGKLVSDVSGAVAGLSGFINPNISAAAYATHLLSRPKDDR